MKNLVARVNYAFHNRHNLIVEPIDSKPIPKVVCLLFYALAIESLHLPLNFLCNDRVCTVRNELSQRHRPVCAKQVWPSLQNFSMKVFKKAFKQCHLKQKLVL